MGPESRSRSISSCFMLLNSRDDGCDTPDTVVAIKKEASLDTENQPAVYCSLAREQQQQPPLKSQFCSALRNR